MVKFYDKEFQDTEVAILMATYNGEKYLCDQLDSLLRQSYSEFVCFIHDDGSSDGTQEIIDKYCTNYPQRFVCINGNQCGGAKENFMYLLNIVYADYIMFCDQDDYWVSTKIEKSLSAMKALEKEYGKNFPCCIYGDLTVSNEKLETIADSYYQYMGKTPTDNTLIDLLKVNVVVGCTMMINSRLQVIALNISNPDNIFMHDWWCALICSVQGKFRYIQGPLCLYRQHSGNAVGARGKPNFFRKIKNVLSINTWIDFRKMQITRQRKFAKELLNITPVENDYYDFLALLEKINEKGKIERVKFYYHNNLFINHKNIILQLLFV